MQSQVETDTPLYRFQFTDALIPADSKRVGPKPVADPTADGWRTAEQAPASRFWRRQFGKEVTVLQRKVDWYVGVLFPLVCFYFDPFVFRFIDGGPGMFGFAQPFAYSLGFVSVLAMAAWLLWGDRLGWLCAWISGLFFTAGAISLLVGLVLAPFSLLGLFALVGALGFTPLVASIVYFRNGVRAMRTLSTFGDRRTLRYVAGLSALACLVIPWVINQQFR